jgi:hypothetical protein
MGTASARSASLGASDATLDGGARRLVDSVWAGRLEWQPGAAGVDVTRAREPGSHDGMPRSLERPPGGWARIEDAGQALQAFELAARRLITQMRPHEEWREVEDLAIQLVSAVGLCFLTPPDAAFAGKLRRALLALQAESLVMRRAWAVRAIVQWAPEWQRATTGDQREWAAKQLVHHLAVLDEAFSGLDLTMLGEKLRDYTDRPQRTPGARGAERILAELIADDCDALGFEGSEVDDIRDTLLRAVDKYQKDAD